MFMLHFQFLSDPFFPISSVDNPNHVGLDLDHATHGESE
jgi:hypothetical protein